MYTLSATLALPLAAFALPPAIPPATLAVASPASSATPLLASAPAASILSAASSVPSSAITTVKNATIGPAADPFSAYEAIGKACAQISSCTPGMKVNGTNSQGYTAMIQLGKKCGGVSSWNTQACTGLFWNLLQAMSRTDLTQGFDLAFVKSSIDGTVVQFDYTG